MGDIANTKILWLKGILFFALGCMAAITLLIRNPDLMLAILLGICIWAFCRAYYFAFYVIEHYADPHYRFAGLFDFLRYAIGRPRPDQSTNDEP